MIQERNIKGGKFTNTVILEPKDRENCSKCGKKFLKNNWIRIQRKYDVKTNTYSYTGRAFCFECSEKDTTLCGTLALIIKDCEKDDMA